MLLCEVVVHLTTSNCCSNPKTSLAKLGSQRAKKDLRFTAVKKDTACKNKVLSSNVYGLLLCKELKRFCSRLCGNFFARCNFQSNALVFSLKVQLFIVVGGKFGYSVISQLCAL